MELAAFAALASQIGSAVAGAAPYITAAGTLAGGAAAYGQGQASAKMARQQGEFNAREAERAAGEARAEAGRKAEARREQGEQVMSRQRAVAAGGGAGAGGTEGYLDIVGDTEQRSSYYSGLEIAGGANRAAGLNHKAAVSRWSGEASADAAEAKGTAAFIGSAFDAASGAIKARAGAFRGNDDLISDTYDPDTGWRTKTRKPSGGRYY